ncbi:MAG: hypothetical protein ACRDTG_02010 [Pseudonocardiaceae bacterium]
MRVSNAWRYRKLVPRLAIVGAGIVAAVAWLLVHPVVAVVPVVVAGVLIWVAVRRPARLIHSADIAYSEWLAQCYQAHDRYQHESSRWAADKAADQQRQAAYTARPVWSPLRPGATERVDIYGGTTGGWQSLLAATGASLLNSGTALTVLDLTCDRVARPLGTRAGQVGVKQRWLSCPDEIISGNLLAGLSASEIGAVVGEAIRGVEPGPPETHSADITLLRQVAELLTDQPVTLARLHTALKVLLRQVEPSKAETEGLSKHEARTVTELYGETMRRSVEPRIFHLANWLGHLAPLGGSQGSEPLLPGEDDSPLRVVELSDSAPTIAIDLYRQLVFQIVVHRLPRWPGGVALVVAGADCLPRDQVEWLNQRARYHRIRLILLFRHLREDAIDLLGGGDAALFMRLGNAREAEHAATFIGKEHRFVISQFTLSRSDTTSLSTTDTVTTTDNRSSASYGISVSDGYSAANQQGSATSESVGYQRLHDYTISPTLLQGLSPTAFFLVDPRDAGSPRLGECDPAILSESANNHHHRAPFLGTPSASLPAREHTGRPMSGDQNIYGHAPRPPDPQTTS